MDYRSKKEEKFDAIYKAYADDIYKVCLYYAKDEDVAQELAKQTFLTFYDCFENMSSELVFARLVRIAKNLANGYQKDSEETKR